MVGVDRKFAKKNSKCLIFLRKINGEYCLWQFYVGVFLRLFNMH